MSDYHLFSGAVVIQAGVNDGIRFTDGTGTHDAVITPGTYYLKGDGFADDLLQAVVQAMGIQTVRNIAVSSRTWEVVEGAIGSRVWDLQIDMDDASASILWAAAETTFDARLLGFPVSTTGPAQLQVNTTAPLGVWVPDQPGAEDEPEPVQEGGVVRTVGGQTYASTRGPELADRRMAWETLSGGRVFDELAGLGADVGGSFQSLRRYAGPATPIRVVKAPAVSGQDYSDLSAVAGTEVGTFVLGPSAVGKLAAPRIPEIDVRRLELELWEYVAP